MTETKFPTELIPAEKARLEAATKKLLAEAEAASASAASEAAMAEINLHNLAELVRERDEYQAQEGRNRVYHFDGPGNSTSVTNCQRTLAMWSRLYPGKPFDIVFNSPGGGVIDGMALFDYIRHLSKKGHHITTVARGYAASMGGILLQAGDTRVMGSESYLMIHEISAGTGGKIGEINDAVKFYERVCERVVDIYVARSGGKCSKRKFESSWKRQDWWLDSRAALELGFVDVVQ